MNEKFFGPSTWVAIVTACVTGAIWVGGIDERVKATEITLSKRESEADRITRLETLVGHVDRHLDKIENKIDRLGQNQR